MPVTLNYNTFNSALYTAPGGAVNSARRVSDKPQFMTHQATVGEAFSLTPPAAILGSGNGGPYPYILWKCDAGVHFGENGLSFDATTRTLSGTPDAAGVWQLSYVVHDDDDDRGVEDHFRTRTNLQVTVSQ